MVVFINCTNSLTRLIHLILYCFHVRLFTRIDDFLNVMLNLTHVHVLFRNSPFTNDFNFNVNEPVRVEVEV